MHTLTPTGTEAQLKSAAMHGALSIQRSWERCSAIDYALHADPNPMSSGELQSRREQHAHVLDISQPELDSLASLVASAKSIVLLADASGVILQDAGSTEFLRKAERVALKPGVSWAESLRGTNAIGTALLEGAAIRVHGDEHYLDCNTILSCHAAPIRAARGDIIGVLDISGDATMSHAYALGLAKLYAKQISNRLVDNTDSRLHRLVFQRQPSLIGSAERAILLIEGDRIVGANETALCLLNTDWRLLDSPVDAWLEGWLTLKDEPARIHTQGGQPLLAALHHGKEGIVTTSRFAANAQPVAAPGIAAVHTRLATAPQAALPGLDEDAQICLTRAVSALNGHMAVLLQGETGAGKEVFARHLHARSTWSQGPFVAVNCGALPESLIESELFGYEGGAFTGARRDGALGRLREAQGGILFLDEIGDMPLLLQTRLLRVLQEREVQPLGSDKRIPVCFGVVSATNRDLFAMLKNGSFRADLFYRLQDYKATLPPLREHVHLRKLLCHEFQRLGGWERSTTLSDTALDQLSAYPWPGNFREMQSVLRTLLLLRPAGSLIHAHDLPTEILAVTEAAVEPIASLHAGPPAAPPARDITLRDLNQQTIFRVIAECDNNMSRAAKLLGVHRSTLYRHVARAARMSKAQSPSS